jgi:membrane-associated phospholipid phosphatase
MRIMDYWHFEVDVVAGWIVGVTCAFGAYWCTGRHSRADMLNEILFIVPSDARSGDDGSESKVNH